jgi:SAM-dependent methyltransferase
VSSTGSTQETPTPSTHIDAAKAQRRHGDHYAIDYDARRFTNPEGLFVQRFELDLFAEILQKHGANTVFDVPVGTGRVAIPLSDRFSFTGGDISSSMLSTAKAAAKASGVTRIRWVECSVDRLPFRDGQFDAAITARLFQHVPREMAHPIVCELSRVVRPGGVLIVQFRSGFYGLILTFLRYYIVKRTGNVRHKCIFPDQIGTFFSGHDIVARYGYKLPMSGLVSRIFGYRFVSAVERILAHTPAVRWVGKYMTFVVRRQASAGAT